MWWNDEPSFYPDKLGHYNYAKQVGRRLLQCRPPYVMGVCGSWGAGKTSFLRKLVAYLGGPVEYHRGCDLVSLPRLADSDRLKWFDENRKEFDKIRSGPPPEIIWFNPWHHQFEASPMVSLLNEIRHHFSLKDKFFDKAGKIADVTAYSVLNALTESAKELKLPVPSAKDIIERGRGYEAENYYSPVASQRFREFFEKAINTVTGKDGLLIIFIDDLDRCEGDVAYRLLEALKLYMNAKNCVYVIGIDQQHLEQSIAKALSGEKETWRYRPMARDYLSKMFQSFFLLPVPRKTDEYVKELLDPTEAEFNRCLQRLFAYNPATDEAKLVAALNENLPHNPRKIKSFVNSWKLYLETLPDQPANEKLDWRLTLILHYLAQFEEPLFRKVEENPNFYSQHIVQFCRNGYSPHWLFDGLERPHDIEAASPAQPVKPLKQDTGGLGADVKKAEGGEKKEDGFKPYSRTFWIGRLILQLAAETSITIDEKTILSHLLHTGDR
jgi:hypothetical protein